MDAGLIRIDIALLSGHALAGIAVVLVCRRSLCSFFNIGGCMFFPINKLSSISLVFLVMVLLPGWPLSAAEKAGTSYEATTTADPGISVEALELKLKPLRRDEVKAEVEALCARFPIYPGA